jgi:ferredoxin
VGDYGVLPVDAERLWLLAWGVVTPESGRCIQCATCAQHCPVGIDVRRYVRAGLPVTDRRCLLCGSCVARCPRGALRLVDARRTVP